MHALRATLIAALMLAAPALAYSQAGYVIPGARAPRDPPPRFTITPLHGAPGSIGLPLPRIGLGPAPNAPVAPFGRFRLFAPFAPVWVFYVPQPVAVPPPPAAPAPPPIETPAPGRLVLYVEPATAQVFADGYYIGVSNDFSAAHGGALVEAGVHRIDISAAGYESTAVDLRVTPGQLVTYRAALKALPPPAAVVPTTFYLIPGCYMGNIPPKDAHLPATCDQTRAVTWQP
jgi:hypothetical protein